jgi:2-polyprenyl-3-methyl-5-hydroxy-6-metoxy-1,4-benzoquinol methylase
MNQVKGSSARVALLRLRLCLEGLMMNQGERENLWGYNKRLRFARQVIAESFPDRPLSSLRVLDVGCGNGSEFALPLARLGFRVTGIDIHEPSIEHARQLGASLANLSYVCGRVEELEDAPYEIVILSEVLEHLREPRSLLLAGIERLSADGIMIVTVPNGYGEFEIDSRLFRMLRLQRLVEAVAKNSRQAVAATDNHESGHVQFFTRRRLRRLFADCSLSVFKEGSASFLAGPFVGHTLARSERFIEWNARVTDKLPRSLASGWYFALRRNGG